MEKNRFILNDLKNKLKTRVDYILKVYESIENETQYDAFISMCDTHLEFANFWQDKFKPKWYEFLNRKKHNIYKDYTYFAQCGLDQLQVSIIAYNAAIQEAMEEAEMIDAIRKKMQIEHAISSELNDSQYEKVRKEDNKVKIGFHTAMNIKPKKRKYNKKKND